MEVADISVIIPAYNAERYIAQALDSVAAQSLPPREVIVVDDGSTDATRERVQAWQPPDGVALRLIHQANAGAGAARNNGVRNARGRWVGFLDSDDLYAPEALETLHGATVRFPDCRWFGADFAMIDEQGHRTGYASFAERPAPFAVLAEAFRSGEPLRLARPFIEFIQTNLAWTSAVLVEKAAVESAGFFNEGLRRSQDYQLWIRLAGRFDYVFVPVTVAFYRQHPQSVTHQPIAPRIWTIRAFTTLLKDPDIDGAGQARLLKRRLSDFHNENAYYYRKTRAPLRAIASSARAVRCNPANRAAWRNLAASLLGR